jgi:hypothetical protein
MLPLTTMDEYACPEKTTFNIPPYHRDIVTNAMRSGRYGNVAEFLRECIEENGERRGFAPATESPLSHRARPTLNTCQTDDPVCPRGELCKETP